MVWLHFQSLFALSKACSTLVFVPYIKNTAVLQTQGDTSLFTRQKAVERHCSMLLLQLRYTWKTRFITLAPLPCSACWAPSRSSGTPELRGSGWQHSTTASCACTGAHCTADCKSYQYCYRVKRTLAKV